MFKKLISNRIKYFYFFIIISIWYLLICSYTSPLYYFDTSPDNNTFFTMGKAMMHGIVPYKDLFEQKGPYLYLIHGLSSLITSHSLIGMFIFEVLSLTFTMWFTYKIANLFINRDKSCIIALFSPVIYLIHPYFNYGDTTESLLFPFVIYLLYIMIKATNDNFTISNKELLIQGILVGIVFLTKYTQLGSWIAFYPFIFIYYLYHKRFNEAIEQFVWSLYGFLIAVVPWLIYFLVTKSLGSFFHVYFYENIVQYSESQNTIFTKMLEAISIYSNFLKSNPIIFTLGLIGTIYVTVSNHIFKNMESKSLFILMNIVNAIFVVYGYPTGQVYLYYELAFMPYMIIPIIAILVELFNTRIKINPKHNTEVIILSALLSFFFIMGINNNVLSSRLFPNNASITREATTQPQQPAQVVFGNIIRHRTGSNSTLLNYGSIDMGFYTTSGIMPHNYYFQNYNFSQFKNPQIINSQRKIIKNKQTHWLVVNTPMSVSIKNFNNPGNGKVSGGNLNTGTKPISKVLLNNYKVVAKHSQSFENTNVTYWLLEIKNNSHHINTKDYYQHKIQTQQSDDYISNNQNKSIGNINNK